MSKGVRMTHKNGCYNREPFPALIPIPATYRISIEGHQVNAVAHEMKAYPFSRECQYQKNDRYDDQGCKGCTHKDASK